ncbi:fungal-specific transcription factor domain-containing protein [Mycena rosella]|uniref:Fungal-specific transcription factor domain-containing protein n=1 Tax=Mycena rosella TaxID=1033263 RepID=A0AAD7BTN0_MYCRO|nr:fungal-specific transcription factor domain-containing protein [Mycena rosella]
MSSDEDYWNEHQGKKRRVRRACDVCRRKKIRCDGSQMPGERCSTCIDGNLDCTYLQIPTKRPPPQSSYEALEARLEDAEALIRQLRNQLASAVFANSTPSKVPGIDNTNVITPTNNSMPNRSVADVGANDTWDGCTASMYLLRTALRHLNAPTPPPNPDDLIHLELARGLESLSLGAAPERRFLGKSSGASLIKTAIDLKEDWGNRSPRTQAYTFPEPALAAHLIELYFAHVNVYLALLHRPTFERAVEAGLHLRDDGFAATLLLVCAVGSRWSDDPRVFSHGGQMTGVPCARVPVADHLFGHATLYDLQYYCLAVQFLESSSAPQACWTLIGVGLRLAQDVGAHRRTAYMAPPSVERELWKRAFWALVYLDRTVSAGMGRTCAIQHDEHAALLSCRRSFIYLISAALTLTRRSNQPPGVPSRIAFFAALLRLNHILAFGTKILYSLTKVRVVHAIDDAWEASVVAELDSALNSWHDQVPEHLRWDPARVDPVFFDQSVALQCHYAHLQIMIHRPFIPMVRKSAPTVRSGLARYLHERGADVREHVEVQRRRKGAVPVFFNLHAVFTAGIVLLLNVWSGKRTGLVPDPTREIANVHKCMEVVRACEDRWQSAGLLWDILYELAAVGQLPLPNQTLHASRAADHDGDHNQRALVAPQQHMFDHPIHAQQFRESYTSAAPGSFAVQVETSAGNAAPLSLSWMEPSACDSNATGINGDPTQASRELEDMLRLFDHDTLAMWTDAPTNSSALSLRSVSRETA